MSSLTRSFYLAWNKQKLEKKISLHAEFRNAKSILVRLAEKAPHTLFSIYTAAAMKDGKRSRKITALAPQDASMLLAPFENLFSEVVYLDATPNYGSKSFKALKEKLPRTPFDVFVDLDPLPLAELAIISDGKLRIAYDSRNLFPYFNVIFNTSKETDLRNKTLQMVRSLMCDAEIGNNIPKANYNRMSLNAWLKENLFDARKGSYILSSLPIEFHEVKGIQVLHPQSWHQAPQDIKPALVASATAYIGEPDRYFELAYLAGVPSVLMFSGPQTLLPSSPLVKPVASSGMPLTAGIIEKALTTLPL